MPLWRDPFDELIEELERALPESTQRIDNSRWFLGGRWWTLTDLQTMVRDALHGPPIEVERG